jgi:hypothetical protein
VLSASAAELASATARETGFIRSGLLGVLAVIISRKCRRFRRNLVR